MKLKDVLHYIGLLVLFVTTLLGWLYWKGDDGTMIYAVIIGAVLIFVVYYLVSLMVKKKKETHVNLAHVISLWTIYIAIAVFGAFLSLHSITILSLANEDLKENGNQKLDATKKLRTGFEESRYKIKIQLEHEISQLLESYVQAFDERKQNSLKNILIDQYRFDPRRFDVHPDNFNKKQIRKNWIELHYDDAITDFYEEIEKELKDYYSKHKGTFDKNDILNINKVYYELDSVLTKNKERIENNFSELINKYDIYEDIYDDKIIPESTVSLNSLSELREQYPPLYYIVFYLIIHLLILCPFLLTNKKGLKPKASEDNALEL